MSPVRVGGSHGVARVVDDSAICRCGVGAEGVDLT
jgi:hypothetical protein